MRFLMGVDGGATKTRVVIGDRSGACLGEGRSGPSNFQVVGVEAAGANLAEAARAALAAAGQPAGVVEALVAGMAGLDSPGDEPMIRALMEAGLGACAIDADWWVVNDTVAAWAGALAGEPGGIVISGSGAAALAVNGAGESCHADGLGHWLGDEGSGFDVGRKGIQTALRAVEGRGPGSALVSPLLGLCGGDIYGWAARLAEDSALAHREITRFAREVVTAAELGDAPALEILKEAGANLAATGAAVVRRAGLSAQPTVATVGSLFANAHPLRAAFAEEMADLLPGCQVIAPRLQPAEGALLLARQPALLPKAVLCIRRGGE